MTYTLFLHIEDSNKTDPADRIVRVAILDDHESYKAISEGFDDVVSEWHAWTGNEPAELDT